VSLDTLLVERQIRESWSRGGGFDSHPLRCRVYGPRTSHSRTPASVTEQYITSTSGGVVMLRS